jgi:hypothetical protein
MVFDKVIILDLSDWWRWIWRWIWEERWNWRWMGMEMMWTLDSSLKMIRELEQHTKPLGFSVGLTGSVLSCGTSNNDVDIILYPIDSSIFNLPAVWEKLIELGWVRKVSRGRVATYWELKLKSTDLKNVEKWTDPVGRSVDIFYLQ